MAILELTLPQGEQIVQRHLAGHSNTTVKLITEIKNNGYSYTSGIRTYVLDLALNGASVPSCLCFLTISRPNTESGEDSPGTTTATYAPHSLPTIYNIITRIRTHTDIPIPDPILDTSLTTVPFPFLLSPTSPILSSDIISLSTARRSGLLDPQHTHLIDLQIGRFLGQLHQGVQNDWFGMIAPDSDSEPTDPSYSWQETFTSLIEELLMDLESRNNVDLPYEDVRRYLSRAIASFLFDDVEVPSLIWLTGSEDDIYIAIPPSSSSSSDTTPTTPRGIAAILPNVAHALWGDPLLETFFLPPAPSPALKEGYLLSGGADPIIFPRQKTKRIWYSLFLGLLVFRERTAVAEDDNLNVGGGGEEKQKGILDMDKDKALDLIHKSIEALSNAPNY